MLSVAFLTSVLVVCFSASLGRYLLISQKKHLHIQKVEALAMLIRRATMQFSCYLYTIGLIGLVLLGIFLTWRFGWIALLGVALGGFGAMGVSCLTTFLGTRLNGCIATSATQGLSEAVTTSIRSGFAIGLIGPACAVLLVCVLLFLTVYLWDIGREMMLIVLVVFGLSSNFVSLLGRMSGGIFTKGADVAADLTGKLEKGLPEDDPRNPAVIADAAGDNVGDGIGSILDMFDSTVIVFVVCALIAILDHHVLFFLPFMGYGTTFLSSALIFSLLLPLCINTKTSITKTCDHLFTYGLVIVILASLLASFIVGWNDSIGESGEMYGSTIFILSLGGFLATFLVYVNTRYFTGNYEPVLSIARAYKEGGAANGLIVACYRALISTLLPLLTIIVVSLWSYSYASWTGIAIVTLSALALVGILASLDAIGPATDNAAGLAEMAKMPASVREHLDTIDAAGNTTKAVTKSYSILLATLITIVIWGIISTSLQGSHAMLPVLHIGGAFLGFLLSAVVIGYLMISVQNSASQVMEEVRKQFTTIKGLVDGNAKPNYDRVLSILTKSSFCRASFPFALTFLSVPFIFYAGTFFGTPMLGNDLMTSMLLGFLLSSVFLSLVLTTGGGMLDNSKKYVEAGHFGGKGSPTHEASIIGDILGDPLKDTAGPALSTALKMLFMMALLILLLTA